MPRHVSFAEKDVKARTEGNNGVRNKWLQAWRDRVVLPSVVFKSKSRDWVINCHGQLSL